MALLAPLLALALSAAPAVTADGAGRAPFSTAADAPRARDLANAAALRACVERAAGQVLTAAGAPDQAQLLSERILSRAPAYVRRLQVLDDRQDGAAWLVRARCEVAEGALEDDLLAAGLAYRRPGLPRIALRVVEVPLAGGAAGGGALEAACAERLALSGFEVVGRIGPADDELPPERARAAAAEAGAEVVVIGRAVPRVSGAVPVAGGALQQAVVTVSVRAVRVDTGAILASLEVTGPAGRGFQPQEAAREAQAEAGRALARALFTQLGRSWPASAAGLRQVTLTVKGAGDYARLSGFKNALRAVRGVREVQDRAFGGGSAELLVTVSDSAEALATELATRRLEGVEVQVGAVTPGAVEVRLR